MKRTSEEIKKGILRALSKENSCTYARLERKVNTGYQSIVSNCHELERFNAVKITKYSKHEANGRLYYEVEITPQGRNILKNL